MKILTWWFRLWCHIHQCIWPLWSNIRWRNAKRHNIAIDDKEKITTIPDVRRRACDIYSVFKWTDDDISQLHDSIIPPPQIYHNYMGGSIEDDCDGFHCLLYHFMYNSQLESYLLSVNAIGSGHCVLLFKLNDLWYVCDYLCIYGGYKKAQDAIEAYNKEFKRIYNTKSDVFYNGLVIYDYSEGKFKNYSLKNIYEKEETNA